MSAVRCIQCETEWDAAEAPLCHRCEAKRLIGASGLIREKHDPRSRTEAEPDYHSYLCHEFVDDPEPFLRDATARGDWFFSTLHLTWNHFTPKPLDRAPGAGIHGGELLPDHELEGLFIADATENPHVFAVDPLDIARQIRTEELIPLDRCSTFECANLCIPGFSECVIHTAEPRGIPRES
jgi:hypothetical protein